MLRTRLPASRGAFRIRLSPLDTGWAFLSPWLTLLLRDPTILAGDSEKLQVATLYCVTSFLFCIVFFLFFRIRDGMMQFFSVHDALDIARTVLLAELCTSGVVFSLARLDGIPRSAPFIHMLVLAAGLIVMRVAARVLARRNGAPRRMATAAEHIIMIGSTSLSSLYVKLLEAYAPDRRRVIAMIDDRPAMIGRTIDGIRVLGPLQNLQAIIEEFSEHGIRADRVIVGGDASMLPDEAMKNLARLCQQRDIALDFVPELIGLRALRAEPVAEQAELFVEPKLEFAPSPYFRIKRLFDFGAALVLSILLVPLFLLVALVVLLDVGSPVMFWQQRLGAGGRTFLLHKFRTLKPSYDADGRPIPESERLSAAGALLRKLRLDELPQLLNVVVGDMSLVGPRPLLPHDQPRNPSLRLKVRPGITGWAQVNGGRLLTAQEKMSSTSDTSATLRSASTCAFSRSRCW